MQYIPQLAVGDGRINWRKIYISYSYIPWHFTHQFCCTLLEFSLTTFEQLCWDIQNLRNWHCDVSVLHFCYVLSICLVLSLNISIHHYGCVCNACISSVLATLVLSSCLFYVVRCQYIG